MSNLETPRPVSADPDVQYEYDEDGNAYDPSVGWDLSFGCRSTVGFQDGQLVAVVHTSDEDKRRGFTRRAVTREQVADYARKLLNLVGEKTVTLHAPDTAEGEDQVIAVGEAIARKAHDGTPTDSTELAYVALETLRDMKAVRS